MGAVQECGKLRRDYLMEHPDRILDFWNNAEFHERLYRASCVIFAIMGFLGFVHD